MGASTNTQTELRVDANDFFERPRSTPNFWDQWGRQFGDVLVLGVKGHAIREPATVVPLSLLYGRGKLIVVSAPGKPSKQYHSDQFSWVKMGKDSGYREAELATNERIVNLRD